MAHHVSAEKRNRQSIRRRARNKSVKTSVRTALRKLEEAIDAGKTAELKELLGAATRLLDRAHSKGVVKRNTAARRISQATRRVATAAK